MKRLALLLTALVLLWGLSAPAFALEDGDPVGALSRAPKAPEDETPYITQCELGSMTGDAVRKAAGSDIALVSAADLTGRLPSGLVTWADVKAVLRNDGALVRAEITPAALYALLEAAVSHIELDTTTERIAKGSEVFAGFCQASGFRFQYDVSAPVGERVLAVTLEDETELTRGDDTTSLTLAAPAELLDGTLGLPVVDYETLDLTQAEALAAYIADHPTVMEGEADRITMIGSRDRPLVGIFPKGVLAGGVAVLIVLLAVWRMRYNRIREEYGNQ